MPCITVTGALEHCLSALEAASQAPKRLCGSPHWNWLLLKRNARLQRRLQPETAVRAAKQRQQLLRVRAARPLLQKPVHAILSYAQCNLSLEQCNLPSVQARHRLQQRSWSRRGLKWCHQAASRAAPGTHLGRLVCGGESVRCEWRKSWVLPAAATACRHSPDPRLPAAAPAARPGRQSARPALWPPQPVQRQTQGPTPRRCSPAAVQQSPPPRRRLGPHAMRPPAPIAASPPPLEMPPCAAPPPPHLRAPLPGPDWRPGWRSGPLPAPGAWRPRDSAAAPRRAWPASRGPGRAAPAPP